MAAGKKMPSKSRWANKKTSWKKKSAMKARGGFLVPSIPVTHKKVVDTILADKAPALSRILSNPATTQLAATATAAAVSSLKGAGPLGRTNWGSVKAPMGTKLLPEDNSLKVLSTTGAATTDHVAGRPVNHYYLHDCISTVTSDRMKLAKKLYGTQKCITYSESLLTAGKFYSNSGLNCKGLVNYNLQIQSTNSNTGTWNSDRGTSSFDYPLVFCLKDYESAFSYANSSLPSTSEEVDKASSTDIYWPIRSFHMEVMITNVNRFYPCTVKIYLLKWVAGYLTGTTAIPPRTWTGTATATQGDNLMDVNYFKHRSTVTDPFGGIGTYVRESSILLDTYPAMSEIFKKRWEIVKVRKQKLAALDTLNYHLEMQLKDMTSYREISSSRQEDHEIPPNTYAIMVEFQGDPCIAIPRVQVGDDVNDGDPIMAKAAPTRIRHSVMKYCNLHLPNLDGTKKSLQDVQSSFIANKNVSTSVDDTINTNGYQALSSSIGGAGTYWLPVYTDEYLSDGGSISGQS